MLPAGKPGMFKSAHLWPALACFLVLLAEALTVVPAAPSLHSSQGAVALRWQDEKQARDAEAAVESRRAYLATSRTRIPVDADGGHDLFLPALPSLTTASNDGGRRTLPLVSAAPPSATSGFSARAPPSAIA
jgi:hypothetical protein